MNYNFKKLNTKVEMLNVVGMEVYEAINQLEKIGLQVEIQGENKIVTSQFPMPKEEISVNSVVMIDTNN